jgi:hypothetical protein
VRYLLPPLRPAGPPRLACSGVFFADSGLKSSGVIAAASTTIIEGALEKCADRHKKEPRSANARGWYRLLPQLVGSYIRTTMGVGGTGIVVRIGPTKSNLRPKTSPHSVASGMTLKGLHLVGVTSTGKARICRRANHNYQRYCSANENPRHGCLHRTRQHVPTMSA